MKYKYNICHALVVLAMEAPDSGISIPSPLADSPLRFGGRRGSLQ